MLGLPVAAMVPTQQSQTNANFYLPATLSLSLSLSPVFVVIAKFSRNVLYTWQTLLCRVMINSISRALHYFILNILSWTQVEDGACPQCRHYQFLERQLGVEPMTLTNTRRIRRILSENESTKENPWVWLMYFLFLITYEVTYEVT